MTIPIYVGHDSREAACYHTFCQSVIQHSNANVAFHPLYGDQRDGTNAFTYARFLIPHLQNYDGFAIWCDGDMILRDDIVNLWNLRDESKAVQVVKHQYTTNHSRKYIKTPMEALNFGYPRKNWSSVIIWNCSHPSNKILTPDLVEESGGKFLHTFSWLNDDEIGEIPIEWNWLVSEYEPNAEAKILHWTLGSPGFEHYMRAEGAWEWNEHLLSAINMMGERPQELIRRAKWRTNGSHNKLRDIANSDSRLSCKG